MTQLPFLRQTAIVAGALAMLVAATTALADTAPPAAIPFKEGDDLGTQLIRVAVVFVVLAGLFVGGVVAWGRMRGKPAFGTRNRRLAVIETLRISPRTTLFLVEMDGEAILLSQQGQNMAVLASRVGNAPSQPAKAPS